MRHRINIPVSTYTIGTEQFAFEMFKTMDVFRHSHDLGEPHRHPFYTLMFVERADGAQTVDHVTYRNIRDTVFLVAPGQVHFWNETGDISGFMIAFAEEFLFESSFSVNAMWEIDLFKEMSGAGGLVVADARDKEDLRTLFELMFKEYEHMEREAASALRAYLNLILIRLFRVYGRERTGDEPGPEAVSPICDAFRRLVTAEVAERRSVGYFAKRLHVSMGYLNEQVKRQTNMTPGEVIRKTMVSEAKRLLANTDLSVSEVAETLNFKDGSYFCRLFKKETGLPPIKFRQTCLEVNRSRFGLRRS